MRAKLNGPAVHPCRGPPPPASQVAAGRAEAERGGEVRAARRLELVAAQALAQRGRLPEAEAAAAAVVGAMAKDHLKVGTRGRGRSALPLPPPEGRAF